ncbi:MAG: CBS domain-containing protein [Pseudomonadota bacterium]
MVRTAYPSLTSSLLQPGTGFSGPTQSFSEHVTLDHPAIDVMTDLQRVSAVVIRPIDSVNEAHERMVRRGVRLLLVLNHDRKVTGLITATDILGEKPMKVIAQRGCKREEILVSDIMTPQERLEVLDMNDIYSAKVGHIVATLQAAGRQHAMVVERGTHGKTMVRGLFSATQVARQLGVVIQTTEVARTFSEIGAQLGT